MNLPNKLTLLRIILVPIYLLLFLVNFPFHYLASVLVFILASLTDMWDGKIARKYNLVTNLGKFMDPIADKMLTTAAFVGLLAISKMSPWALIIILIREFVVTSVRLLAAEGGKVIAANMWGKAKTVAQYIVIIYMMVALQFADLFNFSWVYIFTDIIGCIFIWIATIMTAISGFLYFWQNRSFFLDGDK